MSLMYVKLFTKLLYPKKNLIFNVGSGSPKTVNYLSSLIGEKNIYTKRPGEPNVTRTNIKR